MKKINKKFPSELRLDLVSQDWVLIATGRAKRPEMFKKEKKLEKEESEKIKCPFCKIRNKEIPLLVYSKGRKVFPKKEFREKKFWQELKKELADWTTMVIPNKYPAVIPALKITESKEGSLYKKITAAGFHEVVITRDHKRQIAQFSVEEIKELIDVYQERYQQLMKEKFVGYISIFHNHGKGAGASIGHPHSQILTTSLIDRDLKFALSNAEKYFREKGSCIYCLMNDWEIRKRKRIIFENEEFVALCPFASKTAFEVIISPKKHRPYFEQITEKEKWSLAEAFKSAFSKLYKALSNPDYNFYLHTSPVDGKRYPFYHWHFTILPKTSIPAGFEIGTKIEISTIEPEKAAEFLRKH